MLDSITKKSISLNLVFLLSSVIFLSWSCKKDSNDPAQFDSVTIAGKEWMIDNLDVISYRNGDPIPNIQRDSDWIAANQGAYCAYDNKDSLRDIHGLIYNWYAVNDSRKLAPEGWHVATNAEWQGLISHLGGTDVAGGKLKEQGLGHWLAPNTDATNSTGFSAYPGGFRAENDGGFISMGSYCSWWLSTEVSEEYANTMGLSTITGVAYTSDNLKYLGAYVRCIKD